MIVEFDKLFEKSLDKVRDRSIASRIEKVILQCESSKIKFPAAAYTKKVPIHR